MNTGTEPQADTLQSSLERLREVGHDEIELKAARIFLSRFCGTAQLYLTQLFVQAKIRKVDFARVITLCQLYDNIVWSKSFPDRRGDPDDTALDPDDMDEDGKAVCRGARNAGAIARVYLALNLPFQKGIH